MQPFARWQLCFGCLSTKWCNKAASHGCASSRMRPTAWKPRSALSEGFFLALWPGSIRIRSAGGIFGLPRLVYRLYAKVRAGRAMGTQITFPLPRSPVQTCYTNSDTSVPLSCARNNLKMEGHIFTARCDASAVFAVMQCPSVCLSVSHVRGSRQNE